MNAPDILPVSTERGIDMEPKQDDQPESGLPAELSQPARRALTGAGYLRLEQLTEASEAEVKRLHGMGPKGIAQLRRALEARGLLFARGKAGNEAPSSRDQSFQQDSRCAILLSPARSLDPISMQLARPCLD